MPRIFLAGVGPAMTEVAGEVADGFICHPFTTERYLREVTLPALRAGHGRRPARISDGFEISGPSFVVTGGDDAETAAAEQATRRQIAFYGSTPAYRPVLDLHGWGDLQAELNRLVQGRRVGRHGRADRRRDAGGVRRSSPTRRRRRRASASATATSCTRISLSTPYRAIPTAGAP